MFERFDQDARLTLARARTEAVAAGRPDIGPEQLLIAVAAGSGVAAGLLAAAGVSADGLRASLPPASRGELDPLDAEALASIGIDLDTVSRASDAAFGSGSLTRARTAEQHGRRGRRRRATGPALAPAGRTAVELARHTAIRLGSNTITPGHLLLGLLDQPASAATAALTAAGTDIPALRAGLRRRLARTADGVDGNGADGHGAGAGGGGTGPA
jgi:Clp amino terminal domain, pathogenicity island component